MKETIKSIIEWHEQTFPDATLEGQIKKFYEEYGEFLAEVELNDITAYHFELADCFIVACGVCRFSLETATKFFSQVYKLLEEHDITDECFVDDVCMKMQTNRNRKWSIGKGNYQHISEGGEE